MGAVHLLGAGETSFASGGRIAARLVGEAIESALADAGVTPTDVDRVTIAGGATAELAVLEAYEGQSWAVSPPVCPSGPEALHLSWQAVAGGAGDMVLCVGYQKAGAGALEHLPVQALAGAAARYMQASGAREHHIARVAANNRRNGASNPRALLTDPVDAEDVLASDVLAWPLRRLMVADCAEGAAAVLLSSRRRGPRLRASVVVDDDGCDTNPATERAAWLGYDAAGVGPEDIDCAEIHHPTAAGELAAYEALEFAPPGHGPLLVESGFIELSGALPVNTSGGALAQGRTKGAAGIAQLCELVWQLRGEAERRQVPGARVGLALSAVPDGGRSVVGLSIVASA